MIYEKKCESESEIELRLGEFFWINQEYQTFITWSFSSKSASFISSKASIYIKNDRKHFPSMLKCKDVWFPFFSYFLRFYLIFAHPI